MCVLAQCENAVTLREPARCALSAPGTSVGSKLPDSARVLPVGSQFEPREGARVVERGLIYCRIFNNIRGISAPPTQRKGYPFHYRSSGPFFALQSGWFGPKFVTILTAGVRVCSA